MLKTEDKKFLRRLLTQSFVEAGEVKTYNIESTINYILLDASDIYPRIGDAPYGDDLIYYSIELTLYREGYHKTARQFWEFYTDEQYRCRRVFEETKTGI